MSLIIHTGRLGFPWKTQDPFLFCVHHLDYYPPGNDDFGPNTSLAGRNLGNDFVVKDGFRMYHGKTVPGFPAHPHRGFETVTYVLRGLIDHADSNGAAGRYGNGDVQWMTAGKGLQHSEMFPLLDKNNPTTCELFQIWLNLPASKKFAEPAYKMLWSETIPKLLVTDANNKKSTIDIVAGKFDKSEAPSPAPDSWAANPDNHVAIWQIQMEEEAEIEISQAPENINRSIYFFEGDSFFINNTKINGYHYAELNPKEKFVLKNGNKAGRALILQGKPINEPVEQYGPFVMNTMAEIQEAFSDFQKTQFGGWPWPRTDMVHGDKKRRFARFKNGEEVVKD